MNNDTKYNGWTNHATWLVNLHISNDQGFADEARDVVNNAIGDADTAVIDAADALKAYITEALDIDTMHSDGDERANVVVSLGVDLMRGYLCDVNWREIAANMLEVAS